MTNAATHPGPVGTIRVRQERVRHGRADEILRWGIAISGIFLLVALAGLAVDHRTITGVAGWVKPTKFAISIGIYLITLRWIVGHVQGHRFAMTVLSTISVVALIGELAGISLQVMRGTTSHYNEATTFDAAVFFVMGGLIAALFLATILVGVIAVRSNDMGESMTSALKWGIGVCLLGMAEAMLMIENQHWNATGGHTVGARDGGPGLPLVGWSTLHGDLRIAHFVGLHALQTTLVASWLIHRHSALSGRAERRMVALIGVFQACLVVLLAWQALRGQPLLRPDLTTAALAAGLVILTAGAAWLVAIVDRR